MGIWGISTRSKNTSGAQARGQNSSGITREEGADGKALEDGKGRREEKEREDEGRKRRERELRGGGGTTRSCRALGWASCSRAR